MVMVWSVVSSVIATFDNHVIVGVGTPVVMQDCVCEKDSYSETVVTVNTRSSLGVVI